MALRSRDRKLSFDILSATTLTSFDEDNDLESLIYRSNSDPLTRENGEASAASESKPNRRKRKGNRGSKKKKRTTIEVSISEDSVLDDPRLGVIENGSCRSGLELNCSTAESVVCEEVTVPEESACTGRPNREAEFHNVQNFEGCMVGELRQRSVAGENTEESGSTEVDSASVKQRVEPNGNVVRKLETVESLDWKRLMAQDPNSSSRGLLQQSCLTLAVSLCWLVGLLFLNKQISALYIT